VRRIVVVFMLVLGVMVSAAPTARAQAAPPCNDADGDGAPSGPEYAGNHITALAKEGMLGSGGHIPGSHRGFSLCLGVHD
jgi:hypothetical protein